MLERLDYWLTQHTAVMFAWPAAVYLAAAAYQWHHTRRRKHLT